MDISRRGMFGLLPGSVAALFATVMPAAAATPASITSPKAPDKAVSWVRMEQFRQALIAEVGNVTFECWFRSIELEKLEGNRLTVSVSVNFLKQWIGEHYMRPLLRGAQRMDGAVEEVEIVVRRPRVAVPVEKTIA